MTLSAEEYQLELGTGMLLNSVQVSGQEYGRLLFSKRYYKNIETLCELINVPESSDEADVDLRTDLAKA